MSYSDIVATIAMIVSVTAVPASGYLSYRYAIKGEKRKEFNAIGDVIRQKLREQLRLVECDIIPTGGNTEIHVREFDAFIDLSDSKDRLLLSALWLEYQKSIQDSVDNSDPLRDPIFHSPARVKVAIEAIFPYCHRK